MAESVGFEPTVGVSSYDKLATCWFNPTHPTLHSKYKNHHLI